jgi:outer membrane protein OmpA-like peptidoglycan-associated protein
MRYQHYQEMELEREALPELAIEREIGRGQIRVRHMEAASPELEAEPFSPSPPPRGTTLLTNFAFGGFALSGAHLATIARIAAAIAAEMPSIPPLHCSFVSVEGHEDEVGDPARFGSLGRARADAVAKALGARLPPLIARVPAANRRDVIILVSTAGPTRPIRSNVTPEGRALNRRVEVRRHTGPCGLIA